MLFFSCTSSQQVQEIQSVIKPSWVLSRPISESNYIGIAKASKASNDYQSIAKKNALMDLSSEISVRISSESIFHQVDKGESYRDEYQSLIQMESHKDLEGYKLVNSWEDENDYYLYYSLPKSLWEEIKVKRKQKSLEQAYSFYQLALESDPKNDFVNRVHYAIEALNKLKMHMHDLLNHPQLSKPIDILCFELLSEAHSLISFSISEDQQYRNIILMGHDISDEDFNIDVEVPQLPFKVRSSIQGIPDRVFSDQNGKISMNATSIDVHRKNHFIRVSLDWESLIETTANAKWISGLLEFPDKQIELSVTTLWPKLSVKSQELNLNKVMDHDIMRSYASSYFRSKGFELVEDDSFHYQIIIDANTSRGLTNNHMHTALLHYKFEVFDVHGHLVFQKQMRELKGVQASFPTAGINAYQRSLENFEWDALRLFIEFLEGNINTRN